MRKKEEDMTARPVSHGLVEVLDEASVAYELISHPRTTTARAEAHALGLDPGEVAKTVILTTPSGFVRAVLPASERLDLGKAQAILGTDVRLATEEELAGAYPDFELGAVPPLGGAAGDRVLIDQSLRERPSLVLEAGTHEQSVRLATADLERLCDGQLADLREA